MTFPVHTTYLPRLVNIVRECLLYFKSYLELLTRKRQLSGSCQAVVSQLSGSRQAVIRQSSGSRHAVATQSSGSCQTVVRQSSGSLQAKQAVSRQSAGCCLAVVKKLLNYHENCKPMALKSSENLFSCKIIVFRFLKKYCPSR